MANFRFSADFESRLEELCKKLCKTKTAVVVDAVNAYASGIMPDRDIAFQLEKLAAENASLKNLIEEVRTVSLQVLKNQQGNP
jgi:hypothetical protein